MTDCESFARRLDGYARLTQLVDFSSHGRSVQSAPGPTTSASLAADAGKEPVQNLDRLCTTLSLLRQGSVVNEVQNDWSPSGTGGVAHPRFDHEFSGDNRQGTEVAYQGPNWSFVPTSRTGAISGHGATRDATALGLLREPTGATAKPLGLAEPVLGPSVELGPFVGREAWIGGPLLVLECDRAVGGGLSSCVIDAPCDVDVGEVGELAWPVLAQVRTVHAFLH